MFTATNTKGSGLCCHRTCTGPFHFFVTCRAQGGTLIDRALFHFFHLLDTVPTRSNVCVVLSAWFFTVQASIIWIIGEYAERIDNADEQLEHFLETFEEESAEVQLQLLTATVKLFLKQPEDTQVGRLVGSSYEYCCWFFCGAFRRPVIWE